MTKETITTEFLKADEGKWITLDGEPQGKIVYKASTDTRAVGECTDEEAEAYFAKLDVSANERVENEPRAD